MEGETGKDNKEERIDTNKAKMYLEAPTSTWRQARNSQNSLNLRGIKMPFREINVSIQNPLGKDIYDLLRDTTPKREINTWSDRVMNILNVKFPFPIQPFLLQYLIHLKI